MSVRFWLFMLNTTSTTTTTLKQHSRTAQHYIEEEKRSHFNAFSFVECLWTRRFTFIARTWSIFAIIARTIFAIIVIIYRILILAILIIANGYGGAERNAGLQEEREREAGEKYLLDLYIRCKYVFKIKNFTKICIAK